MSKPYIVQDPAQILVLASSLRGRMMDLLRRDGETSAAKLAKELEIETALALYHLKKLVAHGLVVQTGKQRAGQRSEAVYAPVSREIMIRPESDSEEVRDALKKLTLSALAATRKDYLRSHASKDSEIRLVRRVSRLSPEQLERAEALIAELRDLLGQSSETGVDISCTVFLLPLPPKAGGAR